MSPTSCRCSTPRRPSTLPRRRPFVNRPSEVGKHPRVCAGRPANGEPHPARSAAATTRSRVRTASLFRDRSPASLLRQRCGQGAVGVVRVELAADLTNVVAAERLPERVVPSAAPSRGSGNSRGQRQVGVAPSQGAVQSRGGGNSRGSAISGGAKSGGGGNSRGQRHLGAAATQGGSAISGGAKSRGGGNSRGSAISGQR